MAEDPFEAIATSLDGPMIVATATDGREHAGCLIGFHTQCSIDPRRWLVCVSKKNRTYRIAAHAEYLVVHFLRADQHALAFVFGDETGDETNKFAQCAWRPGPGGTPILAGCDWLAGKVIERRDLGDHVGHVLEVIDCAREHPAAPQLGFQSVRGVPPGHPP